MNKIIMEKTASQGAASSKPSTTFVQADLSSFREVVQRLTGPSDSDPVHDGSPLQPMGVKRPMFKLHERRQYTRTKLEIIKPTVQFKLHSADQKSFSPSKSGNSGFVPSPLSTPSKPLSNLSIAEEKSKGESQVCELNSEEEEKAIKERRFYLHPSPRSRSGYTAPELLTLFPLTSPNNE